MIRTKSLILVVLITLVLSLFPAATAQAEAMVAFGEPDQYGYVGKVLPAGDFSWIELSAQPGRIEVFNPDSDPNDYDLVPYNLPVDFDFPYYENLYDIIYVNPNGFLTFNNNQNIFNAYYNQQIPSASEPNVFIAGYWDDLVLQKGTSHVYAAAFTSGTKHYVVFEWKDALFFGRGQEQRVSFEIVLYETGDIVMSYQTVDTSLSSMTIGIEDTNGTDGITYKYNEAPPAAGTSLLYQRPTDGIHLKALPVFQSRFNHPGDLNNFQVKVINNSDPAQVLLPLKIHVFVESGWQVEIYHQGVQLTDSDDDGALELGDLEIGDTKAKYLDVHVNAPEGALAGSSESSLLRIMIEQDEIGRQAVVRLQNALPVPFAQLYFEKATTQGVALQLNYTDYQTTQRLPLDLPVAQSASNSFTMTEAIRNNFVIAWSQGNTDYATVSYLVANPLRVMSVDMIKVVPNSGNTRDLEPALASSPDGRVGFAFIRKTAQNPGELSNVHLAVLDVATGNWVTSTPVNITNSTVPYTGNEVPRYQMPRITATINNRFLVTWDQFAQCGDGCMNHTVLYQMFDTNGNPDGTIKTLYTTQLTSYLYTGPAITSLTGGRILAVYAKATPGQPRQVAYQILAGNGNVEVPEVVIADTDAELLDAVELKGGNANSRIMLAWVDRLKNYAVTYALVEANGTLVETKALPPADGIYASYVSVTRDDNGHAVFTWSDGFEEKNLYYALVTANGEVSTPAMSYMTGVDVVTSANGGGNAFFHGTGPLFLPFIKK